MTTPSKPSGAFPQSRALYPALPPRASMSSSSNSLYPVLPPRAPSTTRSTGTSFSTENSPTTLTSFTALMALSQPQQSARSSTVIPITMRQLATRPTPKKDDIALDEKEGKAMRLWNEWMERVRNNPSAIHETPPDNEEEYEMDKWDYEKLFVRLKNPNRFWNYEKLGVRLNNINNF